ncbi:MAG: endolytic transglycosylase MltG [Flavobacteriaceae bacterium]|nr:endolytic transglycosylase MltG [Flavobacteriaceae bacterium]
MSKKKIFIVVGFLVVIGLVIGFNYYTKIFGESILKQSEIFIKSTDNFDDVTQKLSPLVKDVNDFKFVANLKKYNKPKAGRYVLNKGISNNDLVNKLRSGNQTPIKITFNNQNTLNAFANRIAKQIELDASSILNSFTDSTFLAQNKFTEKSVLQICLPYTYEFYWTVSADTFRDKLLKNYTRFWNTNRLSKAKKLNLTKNEVITLASIVQQETAKPEERPIVAGLYLNRLKQGWPLQADPTVIYALKEIKGHDYVVRRVLTANLEIDSPYNTYKYRGLPPSQISMPDINAIDAVLNAKEHNYFYMCADVDRLGYHKFARSLAEHNRNAAKYQRWLNKNGIKK